MEKQADGRESNRVSVPDKAILLPLLLIYLPGGLPACHLPETLAQPSALAGAICSPWEWDLCQPQRLDPWHRAPAPCSEGTLAGPTSGRESSSLAAWDW